jgi:hypothetical protein
MLDSLLPLDALLGCVGQRPTFLLDLGQRRSPLLSPRLALTEGERLGLRGIEQALVVPPALLPPLQPLRLVRLQP